MIFEFLGCFGGPSGSKFWYRSLSKSGIRKRVQKWSENGHASKTHLDPGGPLKEEKRQLKADNTDKRRGGPDTLSVPSGTVADLLVEGF